jgi:hypothetical protein
MGLMDPEIVCLLRAIRPFTTVAPPVPSTLQQWCNSGVIAVQAVQAVPSLHVTDSPDDLRNVGGKK